MYKREKTHALLRLANVVSAFLYTRGVSREQEVYEEEEGEEDLFLE